MRATLHTLFLYGAWLSAVETLAPPSVIDVASHALALAGMLGSLTVLVYRLGVWRQEMDTMRHHVGADVKALRDESSASFARIDHRLDAIERTMERKGRR